MRKISMGQSGPQVGAVGLGCMGMTMSWPPFPEKSESIAFVRRAFDKGVTLFDTAEAYGPYTNEEMLGEALQPFRDSVTIITKFGYDFSKRDSTGRPIGLSSKDENIRTSVEGMLRRLRTDRIDLLLQHRVDPDTPIEEVSESVGRLIKEGKVLFWGLSEAAPRTVRRAHSVTPVTAVESEYSMWYRNVEKELLPTLKELGIGFIPFSPLGKGVMTGRFSKGTKFEQGDYRSQIERFSPENLDQNLKLVDYVSDAASRKGVSSAQFALAWLHAQHPWLVPIPGTKKLERLQENIGAAEVSFTPEELAKIREDIEAIPIIGARYPESQARLIDE